MTTNYCWQNNKAVIRGICLSEEKGESLLDLSIVSFSLIFTVLSKKEIDPLNQKSEWNVTGEEGGRSVLHTPRVSYKSQNLWSELSIKQVPIIQISLDSVWKNSTRKLLSKSKFMSFVHVITERSQEYIYSGVSWCQ